MRVLSLLAVLLTSLALTGCDEEIVAPPDLQAYYTLWGAFDPTADIQTVRVVPVTDTISTGSAEPLPVTVTSVELETGTEILWRDSVVTFQNGGIGHVFVADFMPRFGSNHVFRVVDDNGTETSALVSVPALLEPIRQAPITGAGIKYSLLWVDAPRLNNVRATYILQDDECRPLQVELDLTVGSARPVEFGWQVLLDLPAEKEKIVNNLFVTTDYIGPLALGKIQLRAEVASEDWRPPGGVFDPEILIEPGTLSNVTNGFGFVGAAYDVLVEWEPTPDEISRTTFRPLGFACGA